MFLEEKIDLLKKQLSSADLTVRYNDFGEVMTKIEFVFLNKSLNDKFSGWLERLKDYTEETFDCDFSELLKTKLTKGQKYWWIYVEDNEPNSRHRLFDATTLGGHHLSFLFHDSPVFIVEKKYVWMLIIDREKKQIKQINAM
jgi:hypothetical protein